MLEFKLHEIKVGPRFYILLPKLNRKQMQTLEGELKRKGFTVGGGYILYARNHDQAIHVNPSGLCWSNSDPSDAIVPALPRIMAASKMAVPLEDIKRLYFTLKPSGSFSMLRFEPRMERGSLWKELRASGQCGLAPDEYLLLLFFLRSAGDCDVVTDFPASAGRRLLIGGKLYFDSRIAASEVRSTLRSVEASSTRNSYLPRRGVLRLAMYTSPSKREFSELFERLGEWCYLTPA